MMSLSHSEDNPNGGKTWAAVQVPRRKLIGRWAGSYPAPGIALSNARGAWRHAAGHIAFEKIVELARADGFRQIAIHASSQALLAITFHGMSGQSDDRHVGVGPIFSFPNRRSGLESVHFRHLHIHEHQIETAFRDRFESLAAVRSHHDAVASLLEHPG